MTAKVKMIRGMFMARKIRALAAPCQGINGMAWTEGNEKEQGKPRLLTVDYQDGKMLIT